MTLPKNTKLGDNEPERTDNLVKILFVEASFSRKFAVRVRDID